MDRLKRFSRLSSYSSPLSMVHRSGDSLVVKSVVSGNCLYDTGADEEDEEGAGGEEEEEEEEEEQGSSELFEHDLEAETGVNSSSLAGSGAGGGDAYLPDCKIKRNYTCSQCTYYTQNPRLFLYHQKNTHGEKIRIYECPHCIYASKHSQKLQRHIRMVHVPGPPRRLPQRHLPSTGTVPGRRRSSRKTPGAGAAATAASSRRSTAAAAFRLMEGVARNHSGRDASAAVSTRRASSGGGACAEPAAEVDFTQDLEMEEVGGAEEESGGGGSGEAEAEEDGVNAGAQDEEEEDDDGTQESDQPHKEDRPMVVIPCGKGSLLEAAKRLQQRHHSHRPHGLGRELSDYKCSVCYFTSRSKILVQRHEQVAHLKKKFFRCNKCNYVTHVKARYTKHVKYHSMPMIKCDMCDFRTPYKWNLDRHYKNHMGDGMFKCDMCNFTAHIKQSLTVHIQNHHLSPEKARALRRRNKVGASDEAEAEIDREEMELLRMEREEEEGKGEAKDQGDDGDEGEEDNASAPPHRPEANFEVFSLDLGAAPAEDPDTRAAAGKETAGREETAPEAASAAAPSGKRRPKIKITLKKKTPKTYHSQQYERHNFRQDFIHPDDIIHKNGKVYIKNLKCRYCSYKAVWENEITRHEQKAHGVLVLQPPVSSASPPPPAVPPNSEPSPSPPQKPGRKAVKPIPNLIPIQAASAAPEAKPLNAAPTILKIPQVPRRRSSATAEDSHPEEEVPVADETSNKAEIKEEEKPLPPPPTPTVSTSQQSQRRKQSSFFDRLKERLSKTEVQNLICTFCGHESKCLSESVRHQKLHLSAAAASSSYSAMNSGGSSYSESRAGGTSPTFSSTPSSTRCQFCRQRCKTSADLVNHLKGCQEARKRLQPRGRPRAAAAQEEDKSERTSPAMEVKSELDEEEEEEEEVEVKKEVEDEEVQKEAEEKQEVNLGPHPMENKVFVWNRLPESEAPEADADLEPELMRLPADGDGGEEDSTLCQDDGHSVRSLGEESYEASVRSKSPSEGSLVGFETAPGIGAVSGGGAAASSVSPSATTTPTRGSQSSTVKRVYKCPECPFWATTASRFHVHIVGHFNKKPFECSQCAYRSNWRWDITKHIKLKSARDPAHSKAKVLMTDETGERNYQKYERYLVAMELRQASGKAPESSGSGKRTRFRLSASASPCPSSRSATPDDAPTPPPPPPKLPLPPPLTRAPVRQQSLLRHNQTSSSSSSASTSGQNSSASLPSSSVSLRPPPPLTALRALPPPPPLYAHTWRASSSSPTRVDLGNGKMALVYGGHSSSRAESRASGRQEGGGGRGGNRPRRTLKKSAKMLFNEKQDYHFERGPGRRRLSNSSASGGLTSSAPSPTTSPASPPLPSAFNAPPAPLLPDSRKTVWKCKKCSFRHKDKRMVMAHIAKHTNHENFLCGICGKGSRWQSVIRRHCRLKHDGDIRVVENKPHEDDAPEAMPEDSAADHKDESGYDESYGYNPVEEQYECRTCPYVCPGLTEMLNHQSKHAPQSSAVLKCMFCPFYVNQKRDLFQHMRLHGVQEPEEYALPSAENSKDQQVTQQPSLQESSVKSVDSKKYKCGSCPYVSDSKSQFLYHKQFHRPRGAPFRCPRCSYNVTRRHLLHQHLRVHGMTAEDLSRLLADGGGTSGHQEGSSKGESRGQEERDRDNLHPPQLDTSRLPDVPLVWVSRSGKFYKMFKCRFCPHVNFRKVNILEHEKMHSKKKVSSAALGGIGGETHRCSQCNYCCNNAGVLSAHLKVHQNILGQVHGLVDPKRSDESQLHEMTSGAVTKASPPESLPGITITRVTDSPPTPSSGLPRLLSSPNLVITPLGKSGAEGETNVMDGDPENRTVYFCQQCPARFFYEKEVTIHRKFHGIRLAFRCDMCTYAARQKPHLLAHLKVHTKDYQERTAVLLQMYRPSSLHPPPKVYAVQAAPISSVDVAQDNTALEGLQPQSRSSLEDLEDFQASMVHGSKGRPFQCTHCPARFVKAVALQYHLSLHGGRGPYRCERCDYAVKTYGNLVRHQALHSSSAAAAEPSLVLAAAAASGGGAEEDDVPLSGTDLFQQKQARQEEERRSAATTNSLMSPPPAASSTSLSETDLLDCEVARKGNPAFVYPTCVKNGKVKEKRYKCQKCPSAFEKYEQYKIHVALHGSRQKYRCDKCDYSVKYYANYIQHIRKHRRNEDAHRTLGLPPGLLLLPPNAHAAVDSALPPSSKMQGLDGTSPSKAAGAAEDSGAGKDQKNGSAFPMTAMPPELTTAERQQLLLQQKRRMDGPGAMSGGGSGGASGGAAAASGKEEDQRKAYYCAFCPYSNQRRDAVESHTQRHTCVSGANAYTCAFCDYSVPQQHFLRDHLKLHFRPSRFLRPEAFLRCQRMELWVEEASGGGDVQQGRSLVFRDGGQKREEPVRDEEEDPSPDGKRRILVDVRTGEPLLPPEVLCSSTSSLRRKSGSSSSAPDAALLPNGDGQEAEEEAEVREKASRMPHLQAKRRRKRRRRKRRSKSLGGEASLGEPATKRRRKRGAAAEREGVEGAAFQGIKVEARTTASSDE